ncbi:hypothetical protein MYCTH_2307685 [Thermothelomyces thermophilus ATCC 42464]|uniref:Uncharacterized protein n=1 Tax=Thermothelomyces thermophilus (strain ATCC 42464 / BCRC 31852 / DSM 1799) TaxID=573729 RepID=G2QGK2_THET4|nr:uncharacterized protein MYCTH_2307685 [Thermothelomyces thermophilus ATCC 42464]AEO59412.1 hypothetical protein MYCTH_2307685 [Thermothelomyces thermophilus ATCC 42464]
MAAGLGSSPVLFHSLHLLPSASVLPQAVHVPQPLAHSSPTSSSPDSPEPYSEEADPLRMGNLFSKEKKRSKRRPDDSPPERYYGRQPGVQSAYRPVPVDPRNNRAPPRSGQTSYQVNRNLPAPNQPYNYQPLNARLPPNPRQQVIIPNSYRQNCYPYEQQRPQQERTPKTCPYFRLTEIICKECKKRNESCPFAGDLETRLVVQRARINTVGYVGPAADLNQRIDNKELIIIRSLPEWELEIDFCGPVHQFRAGTIMNVLEAHLKPPNLYYYDPEAEGRKRKQQSTQRLFSLPDLLRDLGRKGAEFKCVSENEVLLAIAEPYRR